MDLQKSRGYFGEEMIGFDNEGELYKAIVCFIVVGLKESIPYVIKSSPETNIDSNWLKTELLDSLEILSNCGFRFRAFVCAKHPSNFPSFKKLWNMLTRIWMNYTCYTSPKKYTFAATLST